MIVALLQVKRERERERERDREREIWGPTHPSIISIFLKFLAAKTLFCFERGSSSSSSSSSSAQWGLKMEVMVTTAACH
jgi:hypothetical protein